MGLKIRLISLLDVEARVHRENTKDGSLNFLPRKKSILLSYNYHKNQFFLPQLENQTPDITPPLSFKTGHVTSLAGFARWFFSFPFMFISTEYLKNHSES